MTVIRGEQTVGELVTKHPALWRVFEDAGIDYCCGGKRPLERACLDGGVDLEAMIARLSTAVETPGKDAPPDVAAMSLTALVDHILDTHHAYLVAELPRLDALIDRVAETHGDREPSLRGVRDVFRELAAELTSHRMKEEQILFPYVKQLETGEAGAFHCGSLEPPIRQMEFEHENAGNALAALRELTGGFRPPSWACNAYRTMLDALAAFERDLHQHIHKENNVLFPRAMALEAGSAARPA